MPNFRYKALTHDGRIIRGKTSAPDVNSLQDALKQQGLILARARREWTWRRQVKVSGPEFLLFASELVSLLQSGLTVPDAVALASDRNESPGFAAALREMHAFLLQGMPLSEACAKNAGLFDRMWIRAIATGERAGDLISAIQQYRAYYKRRLAIRSRIGHAVIYPVLVLGLMAVIVIALISFSLPRFAEIYTSLRAELPLPTRILLDFAHWGTPIVALAGGAIASTFLMIHKNSSLRHRAHRAYLRVPLIGKLLATYHVAEFMRHLSLLLRAGMPHVDALREVAKSLSNEVFSHNLMCSAERVNEGMPLSRSLAMTGLFPESCIKVMEAGETSGALEHQLSFLAEHFEEILDFRLTRLLAIFEPLLILVIGLLVGGVVIAMYLPIFSVAEIIP